MHACKHARSKRLLMTATEGHRFSLAGDWVLAFGKAWLLAQRNTDGLQCQ